MTKGATTISMMTSQWRQGRMFIAAMLLALASALVPALFPTGPSATRHNGSAFDPTTSAVALRVKAQALIPTDMQRDEGLAKAPVAPALAVLPSRPTETAPRLALSHPSTAGAAVLAPRLRQRLITRAQPRAPPLPTA